MARTPAALLVVLAAACGGGGGTAVDADPTDPRFATTLVVVVNPVVNADNRATVPTPGAVRAGVMVIADDGPVDTTGDDGIAVLAPLGSGIRTVQLLGGGIAGSFDVSVGPGTIREVAIAADGDRAEIMLDSSYMSDRFVELSPATPTARINEALLVSDRLVFLERGVYTGDLDVAGTQVTLLGEGIRGGGVTLQGNATISGEQSRIRGLGITGKLSITARDTAASFSRVDGVTSVAGNNMTLLANALCGGAAITGTATAVVGNRGLPPTTTCP
jgi:hypothetical protein